MNFAHQFLKFNRQELFRKVFIYRMCFLKNLKNFAKSEEMDKFADDTNFYWEQVKQTIDWNELLCGNLFDPEANHNNYYYEVLEKCFGKKLPVYLFL